MDQGGRSEDSHDKTHAQAGMIVCNECDLLQQAAVLPRGGSLLCARCDAPLRSWVAQDLDRPLALALAAAMSFLIGNVFPVMTLEFQAQRINGSMLGAVWQMHMQGETVVGLLVLATAVLAPAALISLLLWLLLPLRFGFRAPFFAPLFRLLMAVSSWAMVEVLMVGVVVSLVKLGHDATATVGIGLWAYGATMLLLTLLSSSLQGEVIWAQHERVMGVRPLAGVPDAEVLS
ncbi:MAG TPA: paraquat-inducible protein A [Rhodocyclaceae bacterium]|nr:paraquat-inducible protein A [Rhodocyclaceae bacterium]